MGEVYRAYDKKTEQLVALKFLLEADAKNIKGFKREFVSSCHLDHPNLVHVYEFFEEQNHCFFSMELVEGTGFLSYVRRTQSSFDEERLRQCLAQAATGLAELHRHGLVHRDLKPSNMIVEPGGRLVILDFGLATEVVQEQQIDNIAAVGTSAYMAPEQSVGMPVTAAVDWYALGVTMYRALTGRLPYEGSSYKMALDRMVSEPLPPSHHVPEAPADLSSLCLDLLRYDPRARPKGIAVLERLGVHHSLPPEHRFAGVGAETYEQSIPYVGRHQELETLHAALTESRHGTPVSITILGEAGEGKTALAREFLSQAMMEHENLVILSGRFLKNSASRFQAFEEIISDLSNRLIESSTLERSGEPLVSPVEAATVVQVFPALRQVAALTSIASVLPKDADLGAVRTQAFQTVRKLLHLLAGQHKLALFIDDLQWIREDSRDLLREIVYPDDGLSLPMLLVATMRTGRDRELAEIVDRGKTLLLKKLCDEDVADLCRALFKIHHVEVPAPERLAAIVAEAKGHPLFVKELVRHLMSGIDVRPGRLEEMIWSRVQALERGDRILLELISLAGVAVKYETLASAADIDLPECRRRVSRLLVHNFARTTGGYENEGVEPYHDRIHEVIEERLDKETAKVHHQRLAQAMQFEEGIYDQALVVGHLEKAGERKEAGNLAERAACKAANILAFGQAVGLLRTAIRLGEHGQNERQKLLMDLGDALCAIGKGAEASKVYLEARQGVDTAARFDLWRRAAQQLILAGHLEQGFEEIRVLLSEIGEGFSRNRMRTLVSLLWKRALLKLRGIHWNEMHESDIEPKDLARIDVYQVVGENVTLIDYAIGSNYQVKSLLHALRLGATKRICSAFTVEATIVSSQGTEGSFRRAQKLLKQADAIAKKHSKSDLTTLVRGCEGIYSYWKGNLLKAIQLLLEAEKNFSVLGQGSTIYLNNTRFFLLHSYRMTGNFDEIMKRSEYYLRDAMRRGDKYMEANIRYQRGQVWLIRDQPQEAAADLAKVNWSPLESVGYHMQHYHNTIARAELALYLGDISDKYETFEQSLRAMAKTLLLRVGVVRAGANWIKGRIFLALAEVSDERRANRLLRQVKRIARKLTTKNTGFRQSDVLGLLLLAAIADRKGKTQDAIEYLKTTITEADEKETPQLAATARIRLGQIIGSEEGTQFVADGEQWMQKNGVVNIPAMIEVFAPGFRQRQ